MEMIKKFILCIWVLAYFLTLQEAKSQVHSNSNNELFILLGLINDYGGKNYLPNHPSEKYKITDFYFLETESLNYFKKTIASSSTLESEDFEYIIDSSDNPITSVYSKKHFIEFNQFYKFKKANFKYIDDNDKEFEFYKGKLKPSVFENKQQGLAFLKGAFVRHGEIDENGVYKFQLNNSQSKYKVIYKLLKKTGSNVLSYSINNETIPSSQVIFFKPSSELRKAIEYKD